jgi:hypothetical protein
MPIIGTLPNNIQNGNTVDATPVMADFNFIVNQVNANANPTGTLTAPAGTRTIFNNPTAPIGWVTDATVTDHTVWVSNTGGGTVGGTNGYTAMFNNQWATDGHALTTAELAVHSHTDAGHAHNITDTGHSHTYNGENVAGGGATAMNGATGPTTQTTNTAGTGITINTGNANIQNTGSGNAHSHTKTFAAQYVTMVMAQKS